MAGPEGVDPDVFHRIYEGQVPWAVGYPQPEVMALLEAGDIRSPVLDLGCGTGENARAIAAAGHDVTAIDLVPAAIDIARAADEEGCIDWRLGDVLQLDQHIQGRYATVIDAGVFHVFSDADRARYVAQMHQALAPGAQCHIIVFSDKEGGDDGPRRVTRHELEEAFHGWTQVALVETRYALRSRPNGAHAWRGTWIRPDDGPR